MVWYLHIGYGYDSILVINYLKVLGMGNNESENND